jgi:hypothetical protein
MIYTPVASIDGFGDRDDIALARSRSEDQIVENKMREQYETDAAIDNASEWGDLNQQSIVEMIVEMMRRGSASMLGNKRDVFWGEIESISEAVNEACIIEGLDEDVFSPTIRCDGFEYEIRLY